MSIAQQPINRQVDELAKTVAGFVMNENGRLGLDSTTQVTDWFTSVMISTQGLSETVRGPVNERVAALLLTAESEA